MGSLNSSPLDVGGLAVALIDGLAFPEAPRWRADRLWYSDIFGGRVGHVGLDGSPATVLELDDHPSGLGWLPDGDLIVVSMQRRLLLRVDADGRTNVHADLTPHITWPANDLLVLPDGVAYVGHFGFDRQHGTTPRAPASLLCVEPDGTVRTAASDLEFPNGMATRQGPEGEPSVLVVAESGAGRITEFDIGPGGELNNRRMLVDVPVAPGAASANPDGICLDPSGDVWVPDTVGHRIVRLGGHGIVHDLRLGGRVPLACEIVSDSAATHLAIASVDGWTSAEAAVAQPTGRIDLVPLSSLEA